MSDLDHSVALAGKGVSAINWRKLDSDDLPLISFCTLLILASDMMGWLTTVLV
jgi:hypothetical protein